MGGTEAERRRHENRGAKAPREVGIALAANAFFGIFEAHRTLLVERTVPIKPFFRKKIHSIDDGGHGPPAPPSEYARAEGHKSDQVW